MQHRASCTFQSTPPVKAATAAQYLDTRTLLISIHAAREGGDGLSICGRKDTQPFQSTPPVKAATLPVTRLINVDTDFNPRRP